MLEFVSLSLFALAARAEGLVRRTSLQLELRVSVLLLAGAVHLVSLAARARSLAGKG